MTVLLKEKEQFKVVYIIGTLLAGGTEKQLVELIKGIDKNKFVPFVYCMFSGGPLQKELEDIGVEVEIFDFVGAGGNTLNLKSLVHNTKSFLRLFVYLSRLKPAILHSNLKLNNLFGATAAKFAGISHIIVGYRNLIDETEKHPILIWWEKIVNNFADVIIVNSEAVKQAILQRLNPDPAKIKVLYNGVDIARFRTKKPSQLIIGDLCLPVKELIITIIANLIPYKGHEDFIKAVSLVHKVNPSIKCLLVGRDDGFGIYLRGLVQKSGLQNVVVFAGALDNIPEILAFSDIQVSASHQEGFSNVILEGMAAGVPLVVTDVGGNVEAVAEGETGLIVPPKDLQALAGAILKLLKDKDLRRRMGHAGQLRVEKIFSVDRMVSETETLYRELLDLRK
jgi:glycosyltransferase involved in cell wall biosynthesis